MPMSYIALNRITEERAARDKSYRRKLERNGRPLLSHGRIMSDGELLAKLRQLGLDTQRQRIVDASPNFVSAQAMSEAMIAEAGIAIPDAQVDWIWIAMTCLWERWQPGLASMEMVDDTMQAGYKAVEAGDTVKGCSLWLETWHAIINIIDRADMGSLDEFDSRFDGTQSLFNWVQDLEMELHNAGLQEPRFFHERISLCETMIDRFPNGMLSIDNFKSALAESHFQLDDCEQGDRLFRAWLEETPEWGSGWISWSDCYGLFAKTELKDAIRAEQLLQEGLASPNVENKAHILERLQRLYEETGRDEEAKAVCQEIDQASEPTTTTASTVVPDQSFEGQRRVGRNKPCPCGSGKKYKKCCARKPRH